jgi:predicted amidohydrolase YtcJ
MNKELIAPRIGDERNNRQYQLKSMVATGARISYGSDWPVTTQVPLLALAIPTLRREPLTSNEAWSPEEAISVEESLSFYTTNVAYQIFGDKRFGTIEIGKCADLIQLATNPLTTALDSIRDIEILAVYKDGEKVTSY